jgi:hypothetical protein
VSAPLQFKATDNFYQGFHSWKTTVGIVDWLVQNGAFTNYDDLFFSSDTGTGFRSTPFIFYLTLAAKTYNKKIVVHFFCPEHAYNACDAHGGPLKEALRFAHAATDANLNEPAQFARTATASLRDTTAWDHQNPETSKVVTQVNRAFRAMDGIQNYLSFYLFYVDEQNNEVTEVGVARAATRGDDTRPVLWDMRPRGKGPRRCTRCEDEFARPTLLGARSCPHAKLTANEMQGETAGIRNRPAKRSTTASVWSQLIVVVVVGGRRARATRAACGADVKQKQTQRLAR